jgi:hypothetical protein
VLEAVETQPAFINIFQGINMCVIINSLFFFKMNSSSLSRNYSGDDKSCDDRFRDSSILFKFGVL